MFAVVTISFFITVAVPGDPLAVWLPENPTPQEHARVAREFGLDQSLLNRYANYLGRVVAGDLGRSIRTRKPVAEDLKRAAVASIELAVVAFAITALLGVSLGVLSAVKANSAVDHVLGVLTIGGIAAPIFWTALMLQIVFYGRLGWLPAGGRIDEFILLAGQFQRDTGFYLLDTLRSGNGEAFRSAAAHLILPSFVLAYRAMGSVTRVTRAAMLETLRAPYVQTARAFGMPESRVVLFHAFPNARLPVLTVIGLAFGELLTGSILVETVFNWPGLGLYTIQAIQSLDYPGVVGVSVLITFIYVMANLIVDLLYPAFDPRLRKGT